MKIILGKRKNNYLNYILIKIIKRKKINIIKLIKKEIIISNFDFEKDNYEDFIKHWSYYFMLYLNTPEENSLYSIPQNVYIEILKNIITNKGEI